MKWNERYKEYLTDESGLRGACEEIIFPSSSDELRDCLKLDLQLPSRGAAPELWGALPRWATAAIPERRPF